MLGESAAIAANGLSQYYRQVRERTLALTRGLSAEDMLLQSMPDASPTKWHLAHTSWFFETFLLTPHLSQYRVFNSQFNYLFNSYYDSVGERHPRPVRGLLSRPGLSEVLAYRHYVDEAMQSLLSANADTAIGELVITGLHHEMQHQELILTDIKHALAQNPASLPAPALSELATHQTKNQQTQPHNHRGFTAFVEGLHTVGAPGEGFSYDCERPRHRVYCHDFALANTPVSNGQWLAFMAAGGYQDPANWLSDGWSCKQQQQWQAPLYWQKVNGTWFELLFDGYRAINESAPVCHISYFEADAYARWAGCRLPTEQELEVASQQTPITGNFAESGLWHPRADTSDSTLKQLYGDVWEWTSSSYAPYPGFVPEQGALGEYNGKFMVNQYVLRGGSCATAQAQMRPSYRNFFYPHQRWQFSGLRLAQ